MWMFLETLVLLQMYFVWNCAGVRYVRRGFAASLVTGSLYMLQAAWALTWSA